MDEKDISKDYRDALKGVVLLQIIIGLLAGIAIDGGLLFDLWWRSMAAYWGVLIVILFRRPNTPTRVDLFVVKYGFFFLLPITPVLSGLMWDLWNTF